MGRPPIGKHALSGAERQRRYMAKLLAAKPSVTKPAQPSGAKGREAQLTRSHRRGAGEVDFSEVGKLRAEIGKLKSDNFKLKAMLQQEPDAAKLRKKVVDHRVEMASLQQAMRRLAKERDQYQSRVRPKYRDATKLLTRQNHGILIKALHSDRMKQCTADELKEARRLATALRPLFDE